MEVNSELCRMCMDDLSQQLEYYAIDQDLSVIILSLTGIEVNVNENSENLPLSLCTNCFSILDQFNEIKNTWVENQQKFNVEEVLVDEDTTLLKDEIDIGEEEYQYECIEDSQDSNVYSEIVEEIEFNEEADAKLVLTEVVTSNEKESKRGKPKGRKSNEEGREKAKEIYQKLLKSCPECGKTVEKNRLEGHLNKHKNYRPFICDEQNCGKAFYCKLLLRLHRTSIHTGHKVQCDICFKEFPSERSLYAHSLRHKNENRYSCDYCDKKFNNSNSLNRHHAIHSGVREWKCEYCTSSFYRKFNLDVHVKAVHNREKTFVCNLCPKRFGYSRLLKDHIKKNHENQSVEVQGDGEEFVEC